MTNPEDYEPDLDTLTRADLAELPGPASTLADVLDEWNHREHGVTSSHHGVGLFLELLADRGYRVTPIEASDIAELLPPSTD